ncbi:uncharacterized protein [Dermacentor andersoni]|uniref:uncharacterized protein n=1 Tax=Dermacentor andersoni TaxID=34620 RepID=UPI002416EB79|nr:uncharacterized protein LOC126532101 [Dermacentor andersoni]
MQTMSDPASLNLQQLLHLARAICHTAAITIEPAEAAAKFCYQVALVRDSVFLEGLLNSCRELFEKREELMGPLEATKRTPYVSSLAEFLAACESSNGAGTDAASDTAKDVPVRWTAYVSFLAEFLAACESSNGAGTDAASDTAKDVPVRWTPYVSFLAEFLAACESSNGAGTDAASDTAKDVPMRWTPYVSFLAEFLAACESSNGAGTDAASDTAKDVPVRWTPFVSFLAEFLAACESSNGAGTDAASDTPKDVPVRWTPYVSFLAELLVAFEPSDGAGADAACDTVSARDGKRPNGIWRSTVVWLCRLVMQAMSDPASLNLQQFVYLAQAICHTAAIAIKPAEAAAKFCYQVALVRDSVFLEGLLNSCRELFEKREELMGPLEATKRTPYVSSLAELLVAFESSNGAGADAACDTVDARDGKRPNGIWRSTVQSLAISGHTWSTLPRWSV